ncbi:MAG TPA: hypothetical protein VIG64_10370 [Actinomycetota bacterium]|jgi:hypothetical protein
MATQESRVDRLRSRALDVGIYLPLGAYARVREGITDLDRASVRKLVGELTERGQERLQPLERLVRRRSNDVSREVNKRAVEATSTARKAAGRAVAAADSVAPKLPRVAAPRSVRDLPIAGYASLTVNEIISRLKGLTQTDLARIYKFERANEGRSTLLETIEGRFVELPIPTYDALTAEEIIERIDKLEAADLKKVRRYEADTKARTTVLDKIDSLLA